MKTTTTATTTEMPSPTTVTTEVVLNTTWNSCAIKNDENFIPTTAIYCNWTWDSILCWPPTPADTIVRQKCPPGHGLDTSKFAERRCNHEGLWEGKFGPPSTTATTNLVGWTNYTPCYTNEMLKLMRKLYSSTEEDAKMKILIAEKTRTLEIIGFSLSLIALIISLIIFCKFRTLKNNRTKIHKNLFVAMIIQVIIRLTLYIDQAIIRSGLIVGNENSRHGIDNTAILCEASYIFLEYARTAMFMWMFIEGLYLHNVVTVTVFQGRFPHSFYAALGWGGPVLMTTVWAVVTAIYIGQQQCFWGYNLTPYYWILEGPRLTVIIMNFIFLLNIIRVLVLKLRQSHTSDVEKVRKAVRAALVLLPLLGITNLINMSEAPLEKTVWEFAMWSYCTHFLTSFQGLFIATLYCFLNGEVRLALQKSLSVFFSLRGHPDWIRRPSIFSAAYATAPETEAPCKINRDENQNTTNKQRNCFKLCFAKKKVAVQEPAEPGPPESVSLGI